MTKLTLILFLLPHCILAQQCHLETACVDAITVNITFSHSYNECLRSCQAQTSPQCNYFTFNKSPESCLLFSNCPSQSTSQCNQSCFSGERTCQEHTECNIQGFCDGVYIGHEGATTPNECIGHCESNPNCAYSTFLSNSDECFLFSQCHGIDESCSVCITNSKNCTSTQDNYNLIFVVGSYYFDSGFKSEILDISEEIQTCPDVGDFPSEYGSVSAYIDGKMSVCGGSSTGSEKCYNYEPQTNQWLESTPMLHQRYLAQSILLDEESWWITGDFNHNNGITTELYFPANDSFSNFVDLPSSRSAHNLVRIDENHIMLLGDHYSTSQTFMFNQQTLAWTSMPDTLVSRREPMAGFVKFSNGSEYVVIAGGYSENSTELFSLETQTWQMGPPLPYSQRGGCVAQTNETFYLLGGFHSGGQDIFQFDLETEDWIILPQKLKHHRYSSTCSWVPDDYVTCT